MTNTEPFINNSSAYVQTSPGVLAQTITSTAGGSLAQSYTNPGYQVGAPDSWTTGQYQAATFSTMPSTGLNPAGSSSDYYFTAPGYNYGNSGSSAQNWSVHTANSIFDFDYMRGISGGYQFTLQKHSTGDVQAFNTMLYTFGGTVAGSDEGVTPLEVESYQETAFPIGSCTTGCTSGSVQITATMSQGGPFDNGGYLLDVTQGGTQTATISAVGTTNVGSGNNALYYDLTGVTLTPSTAWGVIIPASCTNNGQGINQTYTTTTCNVTLGTTPASPGSFVAGQHIFLSGGFEEEVAVTTVGTVAGGVQSITFNTRYAWNDPSNAALAMQGSVFSGQTASQGFIQTGTSAWPIAYPVVGALSGTRLVFGNCAYGECNAASPSTALSHNILQTGGITFYPLAEIIGTGLGQNNVANLATNTIPFAASDTVWGVPAAEYHYENNLYYGQKTPLDNANPSQGLALSDIGPTAAFADLSIRNLSGNTSPQMVYADGTGGYNYDFNLRMRPNTAVLYVGADNNNPTTAYQIFKDANMTSGLSADPGGNLIHATQDFSADYSLQIRNATTPFDGQEYMVAKFYDPGGEPGIRLQTLGSQSNISIFLQPQGTGSVDVRSAKITNVANGSSATDAAAFGQIATAVSAAVPATANLLAGSGTAGSAADSGIAAGNVVTRGSAFVTGDVVLGPGAGTGATVYEALGTDGNHVIGILTGTTPPANAVIATITYTTARGHTPYPAVVIDSASNGLTTSNTSLLITSQTATGYVIRSGQLALSAGTYYEFTTVAP